MEGSCFSILLQLRALKRVPGEKGFPTMDVTSKHFLIILKERLGFASGNGTVVESRFEKAGLKSFPPTADLSERVCFSYTKDEELSYFFGHIRNSLAHGRFNICGSTKNPIVVMEDINNSDNCSARMVLSLNRLLQWIEVIEENTNNTKSAKRRK